MLFAHPNLPPCCVVCPVAVPCGVARSSCAVLLGMLSCSVSDSSLRREARATARVRQAGVLAAQAAEEEEVEVAAAEEVEEVEEEEDRRRSSTGHKLKLARERASERRRKGMKAMRLVQHNPKGTSSFKVGRVELAGIVDHPDSMYAAPHGNRESRRTLREQHSWRANRPATENSAAGAPDATLPASEASAAPPPTSSEQGENKAAAKPSVKEEGTAVPPMPSDAVVKEEGVVPPMPSEARWSDATVKEEDVVVKQENEIV